MRHGNIFRSGTIANRGGLLVKSHSGITPYPRRASPEFLLRSQTCQPVRKRRTSQQSDLQDPARGRAVSRHSGLRRHGGAAGGERHSVAPQFHSAGPARPGQDAADPHADHAAGRVHAVRGRLRNPRQPVPADLPPLPRPDRGEGRRDAHRAGSTASSATWRSWPRRM